MQKKIIALAIAAAFSAPAFADTSVYGTVDAAVANLSADGQKSDMLAVSGGLAPSRLGVSSAEDLGNGLKAVVNLEYGLDIQTNSTVGSTASAAATTTPSNPFVARQQMLALAGSFGTVATGYLQTTGYDFGKSFDPTAESTVSPLGNVTAGGGFLIGAVAGAARAPRALAYISPDMGGLTLAVNYTTSFDNLFGNLTLADNATALKTTAWLASANYKMDKLAAGFVYATNANSSTGFNSTSEWALGASYDFEVAKLFATYQTQTHDVAGTSISNKAMSVSGVIPVGPGAVALSYAKNTMDTGPLDENASGTTVAWLQGLSKQTTFYAAYTRMGQGKDTSSYSVDNNAVAGSAAPNWVSGGGSSSMIALGLSKKF